MITSIQPGDHTQLINQLEMVCNKLKISTNNVLAITIQRNRSTQFTSLIVDFCDRVLLTHYPDAGAFENTRDFLVSGFILSVKENLSQIRIANSVVEHEDNTAPFCCSNCRIRNPRRLAVERAFDDFTRQQGNYNDIVYEVKKQVNNGPMISTTYWQLLDNQWTLVQGEFTQKKHSFKNYICDVHNRYYGVDLYNRNNTGGSNFHHMRANPFTKVVRDVFDQFVAEMENSTNPLLTPI